MRTWDFPGSANTGDACLILWRRKWQPVPVFLSGKPHRQRSLLGHSPWDRTSQTQLSN